MIPFPLRYFGPLVMMTCFLFIDAHSRVLHPVFFLSSFDSAPF